MMQRQIGDYVLQQLLGRGSMGETFLAQHRFLQQPYVLKLLPTQLSADEAFIRRFEKEVAALSKLKHPHIASIHNASRAEDLHFLIAEPILDAASLDQYLAQRGSLLSEEEVLRIALQIASALDYAHTELNPPIAHGSIKLSNIILKEAQGEMQAYLTDFGLSQIIGPLTALGRTYSSVISTLAAGASLLPSLEGKLTSFSQNYLFLAPEQKAPGSHLVNPCKSDVYAFGVLLYYLLTGELPEGYFELPSKKNPTLKYNWDLLICRSLQTDPLKRPQELSEKIGELPRYNTAHTPPKAQLQKLKAIAETPSPAAAGGAARPVLKPKEIARPVFDADPGAIFQVQTAVATYKPLPQEEKEIEPMLTQMAIIPAGTYLRGSNHGGRDEMPRHAVHLNPFAIDVHPVTNEQFILFLEAMGGEKDANNSDIIRLRESRIRRSGGKLLIESGYSRHPVVGVTWYGAVAYAKWVGKRLPSEAEWEIASCGGREDCFFPSGKEIEKTEANFFSSDTTQVESYPPNGLGLFDMAGNVYEWCQDWYDFHFYDVSMQEPNNPKGPPQGVYRVLRGGCWKSSREDLRCAHRHRNNPGQMCGTYGFRCAADVATSE